MTWLRKLERLGGGKLGWLPIKLIWIKFTIRRIWDFILTMLEEMNFWLSGASAQFLIRFYWMVPWVKLFSLNIAQGKGIHFHFHLISVQIACLWPFVQGNNDMQHSFWNFLCGLFVILSRDIVGSRQILLLNWNFICRPKKRSLVRM